MLCALLNKPTHSFTTPAFVPGDEFTAPILAGRRSTVPNKAPSDSEAGQVVRRSSGVATVNEKSSFFVNKTKAVK